MVWTRLLREGKHRAITRRYSLLIIFACLLRTRMPCLLQSLLHFRWHVGFVVFGQHFLGFKASSAHQRAIGHNALPFAEQVRQDALIMHGEAPLAHR